MEVRDGVMAMWIVAAGTNHSEPETAIPLKDQDGLCTPLAMAIQQGHAELFSDLWPLWALAQATQQWIHLRERDETGSVGVGDQDQTIQPLHFLKQLFDAGQQLRQRKRQTGTSPLNDLLSFLTSAAGCVASDAGEDSCPKEQNSHLPGHERAVVRIGKSRLPCQPLLFRPSRKALQAFL